MSDEAPPPSPLGNLPPPLPPRVPYASELLAERSALADTAIPPAIEPKRSMALSPHLLLSILGGLAAAVVGALVWAAIAIITNLEVGYVAVGLAFLVSLAVRYLGNGGTVIYGFIGALCSLFGILLGKVFILLWFVSKDKEVSLMTVVTHVDWGALLSAIMSNLGPIDYFFAAFALYLGFKYSIRK